jgi:murein DD-endopeptidase MepM/ murein hydrolase activator NlpD
MSFHPVIKLPTEYDIFDFTKSYDPNRLRGLYGVGKYNEDRRGMYTTELFSPGSEDARTIHMGIDIGAPLGTEVHAFDDGVIFMTGVNAAPGDYGGTLITEHVFEGRPLWALHGHLSHASASKWRSGDRVRKGDVLGWLGDEKENGGWNPHLHFQLSWLKPEKCDLPGVVSAKDREKALRDFPDPRLVLGPLYSDAALA